MRRLALLLLLAPLVAPNAIGDPPDPVALLHAADRATEALPAVRYRARSWGADTLEQIPTVQAEVAATRAIPGGRGPQIRISGKLHDPATGQKYSQLLQCDGETVRFESGVFVRIRPLGTDLAELRLLLLSVWMREFALPRPFVDEISADIILYEGRRPIGGVPCDVIYVRYHGRRGEARWYLGADDHLPRRVDRILGGGERVLEIADLQVCETLDAELFSFRKGND